VLTGKCLPMFRKFVVHLQGHSVARKVVAQEAVVGESGTGNFCDERTTRLKG